MPFFSFTRYAMENTLDPNPNRSSVWHELRNAIRGSEADYTRISLRKAIFLLAVPMILELIMESTFAIVDIYFVGKLGASAVATVGLTETYLFLLYAVGIGLSMAVTAVIARRVGEKREKEAGLAAVQAIVIGLLASLPFAIAGFFFSRELLTIMGADPWVINEGYRYTQWMLGFNAVIMLLFVVNAIFRGAGDAAVAMRVLIVANLFNIILDPLLIFGLGPIPALGIEGAAIASVIGRAIGVALQVHMLIRGSKHLKILRSQVRIESAAMLNILKTSVGGIGQMLVAMTSWIFLMRILAEISSEAIAGATITIRIMMFTMLPAHGLANAAATLVGQNLGANQPDRAESSVWKIGVYNMIFLIAVSIVYLLFSRELVAIFSDDPEVIAIGSQWIRILSYSYFVYGWWMVSVNAFNGAGDTRTPTLINIVFFWMFQIPLAWYLALHLDQGATGVFWAVFASETSVGLFTLWLFSRGKWKKTRV